MHLDEAAGFGIDGMGAELAHDDVDAEAGVEGVDDGKDGGGAVALDEAHRTVHGELALKAQGGRGLVVGGARERRHIV